MHLFQKTEHIPAYPPIGNTCWQSRSQACGRCPIITDVEREGLKYKKGHSW
jgi:hypothetical protein